MARKTLQQKYRAGLEAIGWKFDEKRGGTCASHTLTTNGSSTWASPAPFGSAATSH